MRKLAYLLTLTVLSSCGRAERTAPLNLQDTIPVVLTALDQVSNLSSIDVTGVFTTDDETVLGFKNGGVVRHIYVKEGDKITRGQLLAEVNPAEIDAKAGQVNLAVEKAQRDYERVLRLYKDSVATLEQLQNAKTALDVSREDIKSIRFNQQFSRIHAPTNGYVLAKLANVGQVVGPGTPVLQVNGASDGQWMLKVGVSDRQWAAIRQHDKASIETDAVPGSLSATVFKKSEGLDPNSGTFAIFLKLTEKPSSALAAGVFGKARITTGSPHTEQSNWQIPFSALLDADGDKGYVFVTEDGKTAKRQEVKIAHIEKDWVTVSQGLEQARFLITAGSPYLLDGSPIMVAQPK